MLGHIDITFISIDTRKEQSTDKRKKRVKENRDESYKGFMMRCNLRRWSLRERERTTINKDGTLMQRGWILEYRRLSLSKFTKESRVMLLLIQTMVYV